uniref:Vitellinogen beta-sheet shell domain-containing protein n=1 Tax=Sinocyclocheilus grahami TaxID=75366 RepID=A0A672L6Z3_SINGR
ARVVRVDRKLLGYQLTAYLDMPTSRVQIIVVSIAVKNNWKMCADGVFLSKHNVGARIAWGAECQQYAITINAETGHQGPSPMAYLKVKCEKVPTIITTYAKRFGYSSSQMFHFIYVNISTHFSFPSLFKSLNVIARIPEMTLSRMDIPLPIAVPINPDGTLSIQIDEDILSWIQKHIKEE